MYELAGTLAASNNYGEFINEPHPVIGTPQASFYAL